MVQRDELVCATVLPGGPFSLDLHFSTLFRAKDMGEAGEGIFE